MEARIDHAGQARTRRHLIVDKHDILAILDEMPREVDADKLMSRLYFLKQLEAGEAEIRAGALTPHDQVVERSREWRRLSGQ